MNSQIERPEMGARFTLGQLLTSISVLAVAMALISQYWRMVNSTVDERTVPLFSASPASLLFLVSGLLVLGILTIVFLRILIKREQYFLGGICVLGLSACLWFVYPLIASNVIAPVRGNQTAELHNDAAAIVATAIDRFFARTQAWPHSWDALDDDIANVIAEINHGKPPLTTPSATGVLDAGEESQSIFSRSPDLGEMTAKDLRELVQIDFDADPKALAKMNWVEFNGIIPSKPAYNFYRVEFRKLIRRLNETLGPSESPHSTAK
ncbi:MAG: hypothetical protein ACK5OB_15210 [Pirellula sp.]